MYQITNLSQKGWLYFKLDNDEYSLFSYEQEVLFFTGTLLEIIEISEEFNEDTGIIYFLVQLKLHDLLSENYDKK